MSEKASIRITINFKNKQNNLDLKGRIVHLQHDKVAKMGEMFQVWIDEAEIEYAVNITPEVDKVINSVAAIIVMPSGKLLMVKRKGEPFNNYWCLAGGKLEPNETFEEACLREVKEETGLDIIINQKLGSYVEYATYKGIRCEFRPTVFVCIPRFLDQKVKAQESEVNEIAEFSLQEATQTALAFRHNDMVQD